MKKTLLVIGDEKNKKGGLDFSLKRLIQHTKKLDAKGNLNLKTINYQNALNGKLPEINDKQITIMLFFPFKYWNEKIEVYNKDERVYGGKKFGTQFGKFFTTVEKTLKEKYPDKKINYINSPKSCILDRDKKKAKELFLKNNIPTPQIFAVKKAQAIERLTEEGKSLYLKPRFGSMGKGITHVSKQGILTNFLFRKNQITSRPYDYNWKFSRVNNEKQFLNKLLLKNVICEEAIEPTVHKERRFDFRVYIIYGKVTYFYAKSMKKDSIVTNWSQGGRIEKKNDFYKCIPENKILLMLSLARKTARVLGLSYAGIDILFSKGFKKIYVLEAHSFPAYEKGFDLMRFLSKMI